MPELGKIFSFLGDFPLLCAFVLIDFCSFLILLKSFMDIQWRFDLENPMQLKWKYWHHSFPAVIAAIPFMAGICGANLWISAKTSSDSFWTPFYSFSGFSWAVFLIWLTLTGVCCVLMGARMLIPFFIGWLVFVSSDLRMRRSWIGHLPSALLSPTQQDSFSLKPLNGNLMNPNGLIPQWLGVCRTIPVKKGSQWRVEIEIEKMVFPQNIKVSGRCWLFINDSVEKEAGDLSWPSFGKISNWKMGERLLLQGFPVPVRKDVLPSGFMYASWCANKQIFHQFFLKKQDGCVLSNRASQTKNSGIFKSFFAKTSILFWTIKNWLQGLQLWMVAIIDKYVDDPQGKSIAQAILCGYRSEMDSDLAQAYTKTGVVHIIAISGMHLSMVFSLLGFLPENRSSRVHWLVRSCLVLGVIWLYSLTAGGGASILRAAVMSTLYLFGLLTRKRSNSINLLGASALILLIIEPRFLWEIGFQLSFLAVAGILIFNPLLTQWAHNRFPVKHPLLKSVWSMLLITISAQITTFPLVLWHFHQFPTLFVLSNLVALPISSLLLPLLILLIICSGWSTTAMILGGLINGLLKYMNDYIQWLAGLKMVSWPHIYIDLLQVVVLFLFVYWLIWALQKRDLRSTWNGLFLAKAKFSMGVLGLSLPLLGLMARNLSFYKACHQKRLVVFHHRNFSWMECYEGRKATSYLLLNQKVEVNQKDFVSFFEQTVQPVRAAWRIYENVLPQYYLEGGCWLEKPKIWIPGGFPPKGLDTTHNSTLGEVSERNAAAMEKIRGCSWVILGGHLTFSERKKWTEWAVDHERRIHDTRKDGSFVFQMN